MNILRLLFSFWLINIGVVQAQGIAIPKAGGNAERPSQDYQVEVRVKQFKLIGWVDLPDQGITEKSIQKKLQQWLDEKGELLTFDELREITDKLTGVFRNAGLTFHRAIFPPQDVTHQIIIIHVISGKLSDVQVRGESRYNEEQIKQPFQPLFGKPVVKQQIEEALLLINDYPGLEVFGYFSRGKGTGNTRVNIKIKQEDLWQGRLQLDNHGSESTGEYRARGLLQWSNLSGYGDQLNVELMQSAYPENNTYGSLAYLFPLFSPRSWLGLSLSNNQFEVGGDVSSLQLSGDALIAKVDYQYKLIRGYQRNHSIGTYIEKKTSNFKSDLLPDVLDDKEETLALGAYWRWNQSFWDTRMGQSLTLDLYAGEFDSQSAEVEGESFNKASLFYDISLRTTEFGHWYSNTFALTLKSQYSDKFVPSVEQFLLSGPFAVRALPPGYYSADRGGIASVQWYFHPPRQLGINWQPYLFIDQGYGEKLAADESSQSTLKATGYGLGLEAQLGRDLSMQLSWSTTANIDSSLEGDDRRQQHTFYAQFGYHFD